MVAKKKAKEKSKLKRVRKRTDFGDRIRGRDAALAARMQREKEKKEEEEAKVKALAAATAAGAVAGAAVAGAGAAGGSGAVAAGAGAVAAGAGAVGGAAGTGAEAGGAGAGTGGAGGAGAGVVDEKKKKAENDAPTVSKTELTKSQVETVWWKKTWFLCIIIPILCAVGLVVLGGIVYGILLAFGVVPSNSSSSSTDAVTQSNGALTNRVNGSGSGGYGGSGGGNPQSTSSTTSTTTTTTRAYPAMTASQRIPVKNLRKPTFEIVSATVQFVIRSIRPVVFADTIVTYVLNITSSTNVIQLRCAYQVKGYIVVRDLNNGYIGDITNKTSDIETELLTLRLSKPLNEGTVKVPIQISPLDEAFEQISYTCGQKQCSVFVNRKLSLLVPHFDRYTKHKWSIEVTHPVEVAVVTNTKATSESTSTSTTFLETSPISPNELSIVIIGNFVKQASGTKVEYYLPSGTLAKEATGMIGTLGNGLATKAKPTIPTGEMFFFIVIPAMENYQFFGRNVALIGTSLLRSNKEIQQDFVWNFIFRTVIYDKVTSADKKSSWVYEQSALFLYACDAWKDESTAQRRRR